MELRIKKHLQKSLADEKAMQKTYGIMWKKINRIIFHILICTNLEELKQWFPGLSEKKGDRAKTFSIELTANWRLVLEPDWEAEHSEKFLKEDGGINYLAVNSVVIIEIVDYH